MEYSTECLEFLADYANSKVIPKTIVLSQEAKDFCELTDQFVHKAKSDIANDEEEARTCATNFMILATNVVQHKDGNQYLSRSLLNSFCHDSWYCLC